MRAHLSNAAYGVIDYAAYPVAMLLAAPALLHHLGTAQYGVWIVCTAAVSTGGIIASGFGDANIQHVASQRSGNAGAVERAVRSMMGINLALGVVMALIGLVMVPVLSQHVVPIHSSLYLPCVRALQLASLLMLVRAIESVCISTQRAFERYGRAVRVSLIVRLATVGAAVLTARAGHGVTSIMLLTFTFMAVGTGIQIFELNTLIAAKSVWPRFDRGASEELFKFGIFSWLQAVAGVVFSQADRLILGVSLGATAVTSYALCVQMTQPIYGIAAAGLHFMFPFLASRRTEEQSKGLGRAIVLAGSANILFVLASTLAVVLGGRSLLRVWVGEEIARSSSGVLEPIAWSFALLGMNVTGYYTLLAFGRMRTVTMINLAGGAVMLLMTAWLLPRIGIRGVALARLSYGLITLAMYYPMIRAVFFKRQTQGYGAGVDPLCEEE